MDVYTLFGPTFCCFRHFLGVVFVLCNILCYICCYEKVCTQGFLSMEGFPEP